MYIIKLRVDVDLLQSIGSMTYMWMWHLHGVYRFFNIAHVHSCRTVHVYVTAMRTCTVASKIIVFTIICQQLNHVTGHDDTGDDDRSCGAVSVLGLGRQAMNALNTIQQRRPACIVHTLVCRFVGASLQFLRPIFYCVYSTQITVYIPPKRNKSLRNALAYCSRFFRTSHPLTIQGVPV